jgi:hypothetical protein
VKTPGDEKVPFVTEAERPGGPPVHAVSVPFGVTWNVMSFVAAVLVVLSAGLTMMEPAMAHWSASEFPPDGTVVVVDPAVVVVVGAVLVVVGPPTVVGAALVVEDWSTSVWVRVFAGTGHVATASVLPFTRAVVVTSIALIVI